MAANQAEERQARALKDKALIAGFVEGDTRAFRSLVEHYQRKVYTIAHGILRNHEDSMDVVQDVFVKVHRHLPKFKGDSSFYTWLYRIVVNLCIDRKRRAAKARMVDYDDTRAQTPDESRGATTLATTHLDGPARALDRKELRQQMNKALDMLSDSHRKILVLREIEGLSYEELADVLELAKGTVMSRLFHARQNFQKAFQSAQANG